MTFFFLGSVRLIYFFFSKPPNQFVKVSARKRRRLMTFFFLGSVRLIFFFETSKPICQSLGAKTAPPYDNFLYFCFVTTLIAKMDIIAYVQAFAMDKPYLLLGKTITLHDYYIAEKTGNLIGLLPNTCIVVNIPGPFISFDNRILKTPEVNIVLPIGKNETSKNPPLATRTNVFLKTLCKK